MGASGSADAGAAAAHTSWCDCGASRKRGRAAGAAGSAGAGIAAGVASALGRPAFGYLALGDSFTSADTLPPGHGYPQVLLNRLRADGFGDSGPKPLVLAGRGYSTATLQKVLDEEGLRGPYALVTLCVGVNDHYHGRTPEDYGADLAGLLRRCVALTGGVPARVLLLSVPDWGMTPAAADEDGRRVSRQIDAYNAVARAAAEAARCKFADITSTSRLTTTLPGFVADDGLHPTLEQYCGWVEAAMPLAADAVGVHRNLSDAFVGSVDALDEASPYAPPPGIGAAAAAADELTRNAHLRAADGSVDVTPPAPRESPVDEYEDLSGEDEEGGEEGEDGGGGRVMQDPTGAAAGVSAGDVDVNVGLQSSRGGVLAREHGGGDHDAGLLHDDGGGQDDEGEPHVEMATCDECGAEHIECMFLPADDGTVIKCCYDCWLAIVARADAEEQGEGGHAAVAGGDPVGGGITGGVRGGDDSGATVTPAELAGAEGAVDRLD